MGQFTDGSDESWAPNVTHCQLWCRDKDDSHCSGAVAAKSNL